MRRTINCAVPSVDCRQTSQICKAGSKRDGVSPDQALYKAFTSAMAVMSKDVRHLVRLPHLLRDDNQEPNEFGRSGVWCRHTHKAWRVPSYHRVYITSTTWWCVTTLSQSRRVEASTPVSSVYISLARSWLIHAEILCNEATK